MAMSEETHQCLMIARTVVTVVFLVVVALVGGCYIENYHAYEAVKTGQYKVKFNTDGAFSTWSATEKEKK